MEPEVYKAAELVIAAKLGIVSEAIRDDTIIPKDIILETFNTQGVAV